MRCTDEASDDPQNFEERRSSLSDEVLWHVDDAYRQKDSRMRCGDPRSL